MAAPRSLFLHRFWSNRPLAVKGLVVIAFPLAVLLAALVSLYFASNAEIRAENDVRRAFAIQRDTYQVHAMLAEAAAGVRGFALAQEEAFLAPYEKAETEIPAIMTRLDTAIRDAAVRRDFERLRGLTERKRDGLRMIVTLAAAQQRTGIAATNDPALLRALVTNKEVLDRMRDRIDAIQQREAILLQQRQLRVDQVRERFLTLTAISAVVGLLGSIAAVYLFSTGIVRRVRALEGNAESLARGEPLAEMPNEKDEVGRLAQRLGRASALLRARERDVRESEERFRLVIDRVRDYGIFALDADGVVTSWNQGAQRIKGWSAEDIMGRHFSAFYPPETRDTLPAQMLERARTRGSAEDEGWRVRKDGSRFWANVVITALHDTDGTLRGFAKVTRDMTERRATEDALRTAREDAIAANRAKTELLSRTSHELRTPMNAILGFGQLLEIDADSFDASHRTAIEQIAKAGRHLLSLINDLLDLSSIETGRTPPETQRLDLPEIMEEVRDLSAPIIAAAGLDFRFDPPPAGLFVLGDRRRVVQIILNLLANAAKYATTGNFVQLACRVQDGQVHILVQDDGPGVAPGDVPRLFTAFERLGQQERTTIEGTGIGLALSKSLVESMDGEIGYHATHDDPSADRTGGACFWFTLPLCENEGTDR